MTAYDSTVPKSVPTCDDSHIMQLLHDANIVRIQEAASAEPKAKRAIPECVHDCWLYIRAPVCLGVPCLISVLLSGRNMPGKVFWQPMLG